LVIVTGALHLDGFADTCDGLAGNKPAEERWKVMHDSRAGAFGITGVVLLLLMKYLLLNSVPREIMTFTLVLMPLTGRWAMVYAIGLGKVFKQSAGWGQFIIATVITLLLATGLAWCAGVIHYYLAGLVIMVIVWLAVTGLSAYFSRKFAGLTGDTYGAINELAEIVVLAIVSITIFSQWNV
jgi:adenosylcobinamide-GDP ribazoletransferase